MQRGITGKSSFQIEKCLFFDDTMEGSTTSSAGRLNNKAAIVTSSSYGIGRPLHLFLFREGAKVDCADNILRTRLATALKIFQKDGVRGEINCRRGRCEYK